LRNLLHIEIDRRRAQGGERRHAVFHHQLEFAHVVAVAVHPHVATKADRDAGTAKKQGDAKGKSAMKEKDAMAESGKMKQP
jgi:hypothetical protein